MLFNSYGFVMLFLPIFILVFCLLRRALSDSNSKELALNIWIIAGSLVFYGLFGLRNLAILAASILWNAAIVRGLTVKKDCGNAGADSISGKACEKNGAAGPAKIILRSESSRTSFFFWYSNFRASCFRLQSVSTLSIRFHS